MFELKIADRDVSGGSIAVTWCVDQELIKQLADASVADPQVVICVAPADDKYSSRKEYRKVVPLSDMMAYVEFRVPGPNKIWAFVSTGSKRGVRNEFLKKVSGEFESSILVDSGDEFASMRFSRLGAEPVSVFVPEEAFAPEPAQWEKDWVNHFFKDKAIDQCHFRKRRLFAYTVQLLIMFLNLLLRAVIYVPALAIGAKNLSLKYLIHPLTYSLEETLRVMGGGTWFVRTWQGDKGIENTSPVTFNYVLRKFWSLPFMPIIGIPFFCIFYFHLWKALAVGVAAAALVALILGGVWFFAEGAATKVLNAISDWVDELLGHRDMYYLDQDEMEMLICDGKTIRKIGDLPSKKRTLRLRFLNLKSKVCRPFSA